MELFARDHVLGVLDASCQEDVFHALAEKAVELGAASDAGALVRDFAAREAEATTGFGGGVAVPHSKTGNVAAATLLFARLSHPVEWSSLDGGPVDTVLGILVPGSGSDFHLQLLAKLARRLMHEDFVGALRAGGLDEAYEAIRAAIE
jgi:fructose-specific PTS system IIA-like component